MNVVAKRFIKAKAAEITTPIFDVRFTGYGAFPATITGQRLYMPVELRKILTRFPIDQYKFSYRTPKTARFIPVGLWPQYLDQLKLELVNEPLGVTTDFAETYTAEISVFDNGKPRSKVPLPAYVLRQLDLKNSKGKPSPELSSKVRTFFEDEFACHVFIRFRHGLMEMWDQQFYEQEAQNYRAGKKTPFSKFFPPNSK